jgi:hypothetical protein
VTQSDTIDPEPTSFTASASPAATAQGNSVVVSASGLTSGATGTVTFTSGATPLCTGTVSGGSASCSTPATLTAASYPVTATYSGDADHATSSASTSFSITADPGLAVSSSGTPAAAVVGSSYTLTVSSSLGGAPAGPAYNDPTLTATLPAGETFTAAPSATGWSCGLNGDSTVLTCTSTLVTLPAGTAFTDVTATVDIASAGSLQTTVSLADSLDGATTASATATVEATGPPKLDLSSSGTPSGATRGTSYLLTLSSSLGGSPAGPAYSDPTLTAILPAGETFAAAPSPASWSCGLSAGDTVLTCTSTGAPIAAGAALADVSATVDIASTAAGPLETTASLADGADLATTATATATVDATAPPVLQLDTSGTPSGAAAGSTYSLTLEPSLGASGGPAHNDPTLAATLPAGETFAAAPSATGWSCGLNGNRTVLTCTSTAAPIDAGTAPNAVTATVEIAPTAAGSLQTAVTLFDSADLAPPADGAATVDVTPPPVLDVSSSGTPSVAAAGSHYTLTLGSSLGGSPAGPAHNDPTLAATLPAGETFAAAPSATGWSCGLNGDSTVLTCTSTLAPVAAGTAFADVTATVDIAATGTLETTVSLADSADLAITASAIASVTATATPVLGISTSGMPATAAEGSRHTLNVEVELSAAGGPIYNEPTVTVALPSGETLAASVTGPGWNCWQAGGGTVLTCERTAATPVDPGVSLLSLSVPIRVSPTASGVLSTTISAADSADGAVLAVTVAAITVPVDAPDTGTPAAPCPWWLGALLAVAGLLLIVGEVRRRVFGSSRRSA